MDWMKFKHRSGRRATTAGAPNQPSQPCKWPCEWPFEPCQVWPNSGLASDHQALNNHKEASKNGLASQDVRITPTISLCLRRRSSPFSMGHFIPQSATPKLELAVNFIPGRSDGSLFLVIMPLLVIAVCTATDLASEQPDTVMCKGLQVMNAHACNLFKAVPLSYVPACFGSVLGCS